MSNALVETNTFNSMGDLERFATAAVKSGIYRDIKDAASAVVRIQIGRELGLGAAASLKSIQLVQGNPTFSANFVAALIKRSRPRYNYKVKELSKTKCVLEFYEDSNTNKVGSWEYTWDDAKSAGLTSKDVWIKYPKSMLFARCITAGARTYCPDLTAFPFYTAEELGGDVSGDDILEDEKVEKTYTPSSEVSIEDRYKLFSSAAEKGVSIAKVCKHLGIQSVDAISEAEFKRAMTFINSNKGE